MNRLRRLLVVPILAAALSSPAVLSADARVTAVHGISGTVLGLPATLPVDVYIDGGLAIPNFTFRQIVGPVALPAGDYTLEVYLAGQGPGSGSPVLTLDATLADGDDVHVVAHFNAAGGIALSAFANNAAPQLGPGSGPVQRKRDRLTIRHAAAAPRVKLAGLFGSVDPTLANGEGLSVDVNPAQFSFFLAPADSATPILPRPVKLRLYRDRSTFVYAIGSPADGSFGFLRFSAPFVRN
ncbi:MAG: hypothetical protein AMXMBFR36_29960 [Acidobacteriota bacterium]